MRLDQYLTLKGLFSSREKAQRAIKEEHVVVNGTAITKTGHEITDSDHVEVVGGQMKYVSRGGYKLEKAIEYFSLDFMNAVVLDIGASTGGFSDCSLQNGASLIYAVDVGTNQIDAKIKSNPKVISIEKTNFRYMPPEKVDNIKFDFITIDVSFISLLIIFDNLLPFVKDNTQIICLIKPQFEAGKENIGKNGVVKDKNIHLYVIQKVVKSAYEHGLFLNNITFSPIRGDKEGNIEYLALLSKNNVDIFDENKYLNIIDEANERTK